MICECYRAEKNFLRKVGTCWGTAERDACSCVGDKSKCDFYPSIREEQKKPITHYEKLIRKTPEEMAAWIADHPVVSEYDENNPQHKAWLDWLKEEAEE